jgi:surface antigen
LLSYLMLAIVPCMPTAPASAGNCALWARAETGVELYGAAGGWWQEAEGRYQRGQAPAVGAILVFEPSRHMPSGHVAVVSQIVGPREILVDQSNWYHGATTHGDSVVDTSLNNDWTSVAVIDRRSGEHGRDNSTYGFIYPDAAASGQDTFVAENRPPTGLVRLAVARDEPLEFDVGGGHWTHRHRLAHHWGHYNRHPAVHGERHHHPAPHRLAHHVPPHDAHHQT